MNTRTKQIPKNGLTLPFLGIFPSAILNQEPVNSPFDPSLTRDKDKNGTKRVIGSGHGDCEVKKLIGGLAKWKRL